MCWFGLLGPCLPLPWVLWVASGPGEWMLYIFFQRKQRLLGYLSMQHMGRKRGQGQEGSGSDFHVSSQALKGETSSAGVQQGQSAEEVEFLKSLAYMEGSS